MDEQFAQLLASATPEELQQLLGMGTLDEKGGALEQQMAQALALRQGGGRQYSTGAGAALGAVGDVLNGVRSHQQEGELKKQQEALLGQKDAGRNLYVELLRRRAQSAGKYNGQSGWAFGSGALGTGDTIDAPVFLK